MQLLSFFRKIFVKNKNSYCTDYAVNLSLIKDSGVAKVKCINLTGPPLERCIHLGIIPGSSIQVLHRYYNNLVLKLDNMKLAINDEVAKHILVLSDDQ